MDYKRASKAIVLALLLLFCPLQSVEILTPEGSLVSPARALVELYEIEGDLLAITTEVNRRFLQAGKERWEFIDLVAPDDLTQLFTEMGCIECLGATHAHYDYALILGALGGRMTDRVDYFYQEWQRGVRTDVIVLLSGDRTLDPALETFPEGMDSELQLLTHLVENHPLRPMLGAIPIIAVDAPKVPGRGRPTTASTVEQWLKQNPQPGSCLAISNQPYVGYQEAVLRALLPSSFVIEGVGPAPRQMPSTAILLDNFAKWLYFASLEEK